jgi:hypothetical protein
VDDALRVLLGQETPFSAEEVKALVLSQSALPPATQVAIAAVNLAAYDALLQGVEVAP